LLFFKQYGFKTVTKWKNDFFSTVLHSFFGLVFIRVRLVVEVPKQRNERNCVHEHGNVEPTRKITVYEQVVARVYHERQKLRLKYGNTFLYKQVKLLSIIVSST